MSLGYEKREKRKAYKYKRMDIKNLFLSLDDTGAIS